MGKYWYSEIDAREWCEKNDAEFVELFNTGFTYIKDGKMDIYNF